MNKIKEDLGWALKFYCLTLVIPISLTIMNILFVAILGVVTKFGFLMNLKIIWIDYYFTGSFLNIDAWRWQLCLLLFSFLVSKFDD